MPLPITQNIPILALLAFLLALLAPRGADAVPVFCNVSIEFTDSYGDGNSGTGSVGDSYVFAPGSGWATASVGPFAIVDPAPFSVIFASDSFPDETSLTVAVNGTVLERCRDVQLLQQSPAEQIVCALGPRCDPMSYCGDSRVDAEFEACDDGNSASGDGCAASCAAVEPGFECPALGAGGPCVRTCGNARLDPGEACDDGNVYSGDGCSSLCALEPGGGFNCSVPGEPCEPPGDRGCNVTLTLTDEFGDGNGGLGSIGAAIDLDPGEGWSHLELGPFVVEDSGAFSITFASDGDPEETAISVALNGVPVGRCSAVPLNAPGVTTVICSFGARCDVTRYCGDSRIGVAEACDDGNTVSGDGCSTTCGAIEPGFRCPAAGEPCARICGNGELDGTEVCDDGNDTPGDGCSSLCAVEPGYECAVPGQPCQRFCGNARLDIVLGEACDDGNSASGDGCSAGTCRVEPGFLCAAVNTTCEWVCGNARLDPGEACDDGNSASGDGCSWSCAEIEHGFACPGGAGAACSTVCGDGLVAGREQCDLGDSGDGRGGCHAANCTLVPGSACGGEPSVCGPAPVWPRFGYAWQHAPQHGSAAAQQRLLRGTPAFVAHKWSHLTESEVTCSPMVGSDGTLYFGTMPNEIRAVNGSDGTLLWTFATGNWVRSSPAIAPDGTVYFGSWDNKFYALHRG
jgi:cysteine-rich repeat protein